MALSKKQAKQDGSDKDNTNKNEAKQRKQEIAAKLSKDKKQVAVKRDRANRLEDVKRFFRGVFNELKKVHWPNRREIVLYTIVTLVAVILVGIMIWLFDSLLSWVLQLVIK